jgi:hypothetical protein
MGIDKKESYVNLRPFNERMFFTKASMRNDLMTTKPLPNPIALIVLNKLVTLIYLSATTAAKSMTNKERKRQLLLYSARFADAWKEVPFAGNEELRREHFGRVLPLPLTVLLQYGYIHQMSAYINNAGPEQEEVREWCMQGIVFRWAQKSSSHTCACARAVVRVSCACVQLRILVKRGRRTS